MLTSLRALWKQIVIDSACATVAEVKQRADMFWKEFDFYASDMIVGIVMGMFQERQRERERKRKRKRKAADISVNHTCMHACVCMYV